MRTPFFQPLRVHAIPAEAQGPGNTADGIKARTCQLHSVINLVASDLPKPLAIAQLGLKCKGGQSWHHSGMQETHFIGYS